jgi:hypothetical protein
MTSANIFYQSPLKSLTVSCLDNSLGVNNTVCTIVFGTQNPLKADGNIRIALNGMTVATSNCELYLPDNLTQTDINCTSSSDNKNVTIKMKGWGQYSAGNYTVVIYGVGINASSISQDLTLYLYDSAIKYVIETGTRIITTTVAITKQIEINELVYSYLSPLSYNKFSLKFYLPRSIYQDEELAFLIGKDLSDVNTEINRLNIVITRQDGLKLKYLYTLINA